MTASETQYFALLRSALWDTPVVIDGPVDWNGVMELAKHHSNQVLVCGVASQMTGDNRPSEAMLGQMQAAMRNNLLSQMRLKQILASAVLLLREHDIEPVLLKGFGLAMLYPNPSLRQFGDIDLYVGIDNFRRACEGVRKGLPTAYNWGNEGDDYKHYNLEFGNYALEVHRVSAEINDRKEREHYEAIEREGLHESCRLPSFSPV